MPISQKDSKDVQTELTELFHVANNSAKHHLECQEKLLKSEAEFDKEWNELRMMLIPIQQLAYTSVKMSRQKVMEMFTNAASLCKKLQGKASELIKQNEQSHNAMVALIHDFKKVNAHVESTFEPSETVTRFLTQAQNQLKKLNEIDNVTLKSIKQIKELSDEASKDYLAAGKIVKAKLSEIMAADARQADAKTSDIASKSKSNLSTVTTKDIPATTPATSSKSSAPVTDLFRAPLAPLGNKSVAQTVTAALAIRVG